MRNYQLTVDKTILGFPIAVYRGTKWNYLGESIYLHNDKI